VRLGNLRLRPTTAALLGLCVLIAVAALVTLGGGGSAKARTPTGKPIFVHAPHSAQIGGVYVDDVTTNLVGAPTVTLLRLPGVNHYQLRVTNVSGIGFLNGFEWYPPVGLQIAKVLRTSVGHCVTSGTHGLGGSQFSTVVLNPDLACTEMNLKPPTCTCKYDGGSAEISFVTSGQALYTGGSGASRMTSMTPVLKIIPSEVGPRNCFPPLCSKHG
jgi:hypothetical protein